jgi:serine/threonine-protein kinase
VIGTQPDAGQTTSAGFAVTITVSSGKPLVVVPDVTNEQESSARNTLQNKGFSVTTSNQTSSTAKPGTVISMNPPAGTKVQSGSTVALVIAQAPTTAKVPNVQGRKETPAERALTAAGFKVTVMARNVTNKSQNNVVLQQNPAGNSTVPKQSTVTIVVGVYTPPTTTTTTTPTTTTSTTTSSSTTGP